MGPSEADCSFLRRQPHYFSTFQAALGDRFAKGPFGLADLIVGPLALLAVGKRYMIPSGLANLKARPPWPERSRSEAAPKSPCNLLSLFLIFIISRDTLTFITTFQCVFLSFQLVVYASWLALG